MLKSQYQIQTVHAQSNADFISTAYTGDIAIPVQIDSSDTLNLANVVSSAMPKLFQTLFKEF